MARRVRGRAVHGWLILDKPPGPTSSAAVTRARRALEARKAGHAGTLDPAATGLLAIAFGEATKTVPAIAGAPKTYRFTVRWGAATDTDDAEGTVIARSGSRPDRAEIDTALPAFRGDIMQVPPRVSAVKVAGARAYDLARAGEEVDLLARPLHVARLELVDVPDADTAVLEMVCGKGGYVRAIARDLGTALGGHAHVVSLRRMAVGPFTLDEAVVWDDLAPGDALEARLLPIEAALAGVPELVCQPEAAARIAHGNPVALAEPGLAEGAAAWASAGGRPLAMGVWRGGLFRPERVFVFGA